MEESIKTLLEKDYIVICDTNVYLRIYDYSPEFAYFAIECLKKIQNYIKIPFTTFKEYNKHYRAKYDHSKKKIEEYNVRLLEKIDSFHQSIDEEFKRIEQYNFPDMSSLHTNVIQQIESIRNDIKSYCDSHELLIAVNDELTYKIKATGTSQEYQGRDDDTKEVITSPDNKHEFEGIVKVQVERRIDDFIDLVTEDTYETAYIESCELEETNFIHWSESEYDEYDQYNLCPRCGKVITYDNDAGNGFCINCSNEYDDI